MTVSKRTLEKWRKEALSEKIFINTKLVDFVVIKKETEIQDRILRLTGELLDQHLMRKP